MSTESNETYDHRKEPHRDADATDQADGHRAQSPKGLHWSYLKKEGRKAALKRGTTGDQ